MARKLAASKDPAARHNFRLAVKKRNSKVWPITKDSSATKTKNATVESCK